MSEIIPEILWVNHWRNHLQGRNFSIYHFRKIDSAFSQWHSIENLYWYKMEDLRKRRSTSLRRFLTYTYLPYLVKSSSTCLEIKHFHNVIISSLIHRFKGWHQMQKPHIEETHCRPPVFNLNIDVFRELFDYLDPLDQICPSATCKVFFNLLWPIMRERIRWNDCT